MDECTRPRTQENTRLWNWAVRLVLHLSPTWIKPKKIAMLDNTYMYGHTYTCMPTFEMFAIFSAHIFILYYIIMLIL